MPRGVCAPAFPFPKALPGLSKDAGECPRRCPASPWKPCRASPRWLNAIAQQSPEARGIHPCPFQGFESCPRMPSGIFELPQGHCFTSPRNLPKNSHEFPEDSPGQCPHELGTTAPRTLHTPPRIPQDSRPRIARGIYRDPTQRFAAISPGFPKALVPRCLQECTRPNQDFAQITRNLRKTLQDFPRVSA